MKFRNLIFFLFLSFSLNSYGQNNCICPTVYAPVCVQDSMGNIYSVENICIAECQGLTVIDSVFCFIDDPWGNCNCPSTYNPVCVQDSLGNYFTMINQCIANCLGFSLVDSSFCHIINPVDTCMCPEIYSPVCVQDPAGNIFSVENACVANCLGLTIVDSTLCHNPDPWGNCGCISSDSSFVCAQDSLGNIYPVPNACFAACWGLTVVADGGCNPDPWDNCGCIITDSSFVCAQDSFGNHFQVPNACLAACWGLTVVSDNECNTDPWGNCGCMILDSSFVCALDSLGNQFQVPNACYAACWGLTVIQNGDCGQIVDPWSHCNCPISEGEPFICAQDSSGHACYLPNECYANCLGYTIISNDTCDVTTIDTEIDTTTLSCLDSIFVTEGMLFQAYLLEISQSCGLELPACILDAPVFESDSAFFAYIISHCDGNFGFNGNNSGSNIMNLYNFANNPLSKTNNEVNAGNIDLKVIQNPATNLLRYQISTSKPADIKVNIFNINGNLLASFRHRLQGGKNEFSADISSFQSGVYLLNLISQNQSKTIKIVVAQ